VITAVIGSGVLSLAWSISQIGWVAGPPILLGFAGITYYTALLLADCYRYPDPVTGRRNYTYMEAVKSHLGGSFAPSKRRRVGCKFSLILCDFMLSFEESLRECVGCKFSLILYDFMICFEESLRECEILLVLCTRVLEGGGGRR
jgi:amino acid permease